MHQRIDYGQEYQIDFHLQRQRLLEHQEHDQLKDPMDLQDLIHILMSLEDQGTDHMIGILTNQVIELNNQRDLFGQIDHGNHIDIIQ